jgi:hypothetical protein
MSLPHPLRAWRERCAKEAEATHAKVSVTRDGRGRVVSWH